MSGTAGTVLWTPWRRAGIPWVWPGRGLTPRPCREAGIPNKQRILIMSETPDESRQDAPEDQQQNTPQGFPFDPEQDPPLEEPAVPPQVTPGPPTGPDGLPDEPALEDPQRPASPPE